MDSTYTCLMVLSISARSFTLLRVFICVYGGGGEEGVGARVAPAPRRLGPVVPRDYVDGFFRFMKFHVMFLAPTGAQGEAMSCVRACVDHHLLNVKFGIRKG